jgi:hypothetical protein
MESILIERLSQEKGLSSVVGFVIWGPQGFVLELSVQRHGGKPCTEEVKGHQEKMGHEGIYPALPRGSARSDQENDMLAG